MLTPLRCSNFLCPQSIAYLLDATEYQGRITKVKSSKLEIIYQRELDYHIYHIHHRCVIFIWQKNAVRSTDRMIQTTLQVKCLQKKCQWVGCIMDYEIFPIGIDLYYNTLTCLKPFLQRFCFRQRFQISVYLFPGDPFQIRINVSCLKHDVFGDPLPPDQYP